MRTDHGQRLRVEIRHVHRVANRAFEERGADRLRNLDPYAFLRLGRGRAEVRREDQVRHFAQRRIGRQRFRFENIQRGRGDVAGTQGLGERCFIDQSAPRAIDHARAAFRLRQPRGVEQMMGLRRERRMERDEIRGGQQVVELVHQLHLQRPRPRCRQIRIERHDAHPERDRAPAQLAADSPHANNAKRLVEQLHAFEIFPVPFPAAKERVGLRNFSRDAKQQREGVFRSRNGIAAGRIHHDHAAPSRRFHIDVVDADAGPPDHAQARARVHDRRRDFRLTAHDDPAEFRNDSDQLGFTQPRLS